MSTNTLTSVFTMLEVAKSIGADGNQLAVIDTISQATPFLEEAHWEEGNDFNSHHFLQVQTEPVGTDTVINIGVTWELATTRPVTEPIQGLESFSKVDTRILKKMKDGEAYRQTQETLSLRGLVKSIHDRILYGNTTIAPTSAISADQITGLHSRFGAISGVTYDDIQGAAYWPINVVSAGGATSNGESSMYAIKWGPDGVFFIYPRGGTDFVEVEDMDTQLVYDTNSNPYTAKVTHFNMAFGLGVADWRCVQRLCNIDATHKWTSSLMIQMLAGFPDEDRTGIVIYVPRFVYIQIAQEANSNSNSFHFDDNPWGKGRIPFFQDVPIRICDRIVATEPVIS